MDDINVRYEDKFNAMVEKISAIETKATADTLQVKTDLQGDIALIKAEVNSIKRLLKIVISITVGSIVLESSSHLKTIIEVIAEKLT